MKKSKIWMLTNVVWYDSVEAYVSKFILQCDSDKAYAELTEESKDLVKQYLDGNGEILKYDMLYTLNFENIEAFKTLDKAPSDSNDFQYHLAYERFKEMWF